MFRRGPDGAYVGTQGTLRDVQERKRLEALLAEQALNDPLTGLPNRRSFDDVVRHLLSQAKRTGERVAVGFVDLDDFKGVNDSHGHQAGDAQLLIGAWHHRRPHAFHGAGKEGQKTALQHQNQAQRRQKIAHTPKTRDRPILIATFRPARS